MTFTLLMAIVTLRSTYFSMKKWSKLVLVAMLSMGTLLVSGCLENIEPEGISDLRGAKAELINAQTALQKAQAAKVEAEAALLLAEAKIKEAVAKQEEAKVKYFEAEALQAQYAAEYQQLLNKQQEIMNEALEDSNAAAAEAARIENERAMAELESYLAEVEIRKAEAEREAQIAAAELAAELLEIQTRMTEAQSAYEIALKELAASKVMLSPLQQAYVAAAEAEVKNWNNQVEYLTSQLEDAAENLEAAISIFEEDTAFAVELAEDVVKAAEADLAAAVEAAELAEKALEIDPNVADWASERKELQEELDALKLERDLARVEREKQEIALNAEYDALFEKMDEYVDATGYSFNQTTGTFSLLPVYAYRTRYWVPEILVKAPVDAEGNKPFGEDFYIAPDDVYFTYGDVEYAIGLFDARLDNLSYLSEEYFDKQIEAQNANIADVEETYEAELDEYAAAVAAYKAKDIPAYFKEYVSPDYDIEDAVAKYNAAYEVALATINELNDEYIKRLPTDNSDAETAAWSEFYEEEAEAYSVYVAAKQAALDAKNVEEIKYKTADLAHQRAQRAFSDVINAAYIVTGYTAVYEIQQAVQDYLDAKALAESLGDDTFDSDGSLEAEYKINQAELKKIDAASRIYDDPLDDENDAKGIWLAAEKAWIYAQSAYNKAVSDAFDVYDAAVAASQRKRDDTLADLGVGPSVDMDTDYLDNLVKIANDAKTVMVDALAVVENMSVVDYEYVYDVVFGDEDNYRVELDIPAFAYDETTESLKPIKVEDVIDVEYFLEEVVTDLAEDLVNFQVYAYAEAYDEYYNFNSLGHYYSYSYESDDMPLVLPTNDEYAEFVAAAMEDARKQVVNELYYMGYGELVYEYVTLNYASGYTDVFEAQNEIENLTDAKSQLVLLPDFIAAIEAAKAMVEEYAAAEDARIDALRADVEKDWMAVKAKMDAADEEEMAYNAAVTELERVVNTLSALIEEYIGTSDIEALVAGLEEAHADALEVVADAETTLEEAKAELEKAKAGDRTGVEVAQKYYEKIAAKLAEAIAKLEAAAAALEAAIAEVTPKA